MGKPVTPADFIPCDSEICKYCVHYGKDEYSLTCGDCNSSYSEFLGVECIKTAEDM